MLSRKNRLKKKKDFEQVFRRGETLKEGFLTLKLAKNNLKVTRFGFVISLKVSKKASLRNKIRRRLRAIAKTKIPQIKTGFDMNHSPLINFFPVMTKNYFYYLTA